MKTNYLIPVAFLIGSFMFSCDKKQDTNVQPVVELSQNTTQAIDKVSNTIVDNIDYNFKYALAHLSTNDWADKPTVIKMGTEASGSYWATRTLDLGGESFFTTNNANVNNVKNDVFAKINAGLSSTELLAAIKQIDANLNNYGLDANGMKDAKLLVVTLEKFVSYWQVNVETKAKSGRIDGIKVDLHTIIKCASGVVGGGIIGGLTGAGVGSVVPVIGTTAGGVLGVIGGVLSGVGAAC